MHALEQIDAALARLDDGTFGICERCGKPIGDRAARGASVRHALHRRQAARGARVTEDARPLADMRVGSSVDGLTPIAGGARSFAASPAQWIALGAVALVAAACDQLTKWLVTNQLGYGESLDVFPGLSLHHVQNTGIAFGLFSGATPIVILADERRRRLDARLLRALRRASPDPSGCARAARRRLALEPRGPDPARPRRRLHRDPALARLQPGGQRDRRRRRRSSSSRSSGRSASRAVVR